MDLKKLLSDETDTGLSFEYEEESTDILERIFLRIYDCKNKCSLEKAMEGHIQKVFGSLVATGQEYGYSECTIDGFDVASLKLGGHDIGKIIKSKGDRFIHILIDQIPLF